MSYACICGEVERIKKKYMEKDLFRLCSDMDIKLLWQGFGVSADAIKGFYLECKRIRTITINSDLPENMQKIILAHELGHAVLHRNRGISAFHDIAMYDESSVFEKEANLFAAELLLEDDEVMERLNDDRTFFEAAAALCVPTELLDFKFRMMKWKGYALTEPPIYAKSKFLRDLEVHGDEEYL